MRVVHIITGLKAGGAERLLYDRSRFTRHEMAVVALATEGVFADRLRADGVPVHFIGMTSNTDLRGLVRLTALLRRMRPDVVHVHLYRSLLFGRLAARLAGIRAIVATEHSALENITEGRAATPAVKALYRVAETWGRTTVAVSGETRRVLETSWGIPHDRVVVVPNGVDVGRLDPPADRVADARRHAGVPEGVRVVLAVGRLTPGKHFDRAVSSLAHLPEDVHLVVVGDGPVRGALQAQAERLDIAHRVHFVGEVPDVAPYYACGDVVVSASEVETYGLAVVEAYASGLPVVYVQAPAADDLVAHEDDGRLLKVAPDIEALTEGIEQALMLPTGREHVSPALLSQIDYTHVSRVLDEIEADIASPSRH